MSKDSSIERALVLGVNGFVGRLLASRLVDSGVSVAGLDLQDRPHTECPRISYRQCDAVTPTDEGLRAIEAADAIFICLPEEAAIGALPIIVRKAAGEALIVDTLSVKQRIVSTFESLAAPQQCLSMNPMFSPKIGFSGQNVALVKVKDGPRAAAFQAMLASWGAGTVLVGAEEHDKTTALIQVVTHAAMLSIGLVLHDWSYDLTKAINMATPPHRICLALLARMCDASAEVYWDIQRSNSFGDEARHSLLANTKRLSDVVAAGEERAFEETMEKVARVIEPLKEQLLRCADSISTASAL